MSAIHKTEFVFTVLHRGDDPVLDLEEALQRSTDGHAVGLVTARTTAPVADADVPAEEIALACDGTFFEDDLAEDTTDQEVTA